MPIRKIEGHTKGQKVIPFKVGLEEFIASELMEGVDYGKVGGYTKPTLLKPGAEKICRFLQLAITYSVDHRHEDWQEGVFHFEVRVQLLDGSTNQVVSDGIGSCNSKETQFAHQDAFSIVNTILKMAKKRALIDAALNVSASSGLFTQDLEDLSAQTPMKGGDTAITKRHDYCG